MIAASGDAPRHNSCARSKKARRLKTWVKGSMLASSMSLRGFRFLTHGEGTPGIFVHMETLRRFGMTELRQGQLVRYGPGPKALKAAEVHPDGGPVHRRCANLFACADSIDRPERTKNKQSHDVR
jgi:cold shock CspA family protein